MSDNPEVFDQFNQPLCPTKLLTFGTSLISEGFAGVPELEFFQCTPNCDGPAELSKRFLGLISVRIELCPREVVNEFLRSTFA